MKCSPATDSAGWTGSDAQGHDCPDHSQRCPDARQLAGGEPGGQLLGFDGCGLRVLVAAARGPSATTKEQIRQAAGRLFLQRGYSDVSLNDICAEADVARQTLFSAFGSKFGLLRDLIEARIAGDETALSAQRAAFRQMREERDPVQVLRQHALLVAQISERTAALYEVLAAAGSDPEAEELRHRIDTQWLDGMGHVVDLVAGLGGLPAGCDRDRAREGIWLLTASRTYLMARARGWSVEEYARWLGDCSIAILTDTGTCRATIGTTRRG